MSTLTDVIALLYRMESADVKQLENDLLDARKRAWDLALRDKAKQYGCSGVPNAPRLGDLKELRSMSREDAKSIAATWNRDVQREIERLYAVNPRGNRYYYTSNLEKWARARAQWKASQIAIQVEQTTRFYTQERFREANGVIAQFVFVGAPPVCKTCMGYFSAGVVDGAFIRRNPAPVHVGCPHEWQEITFERLECGEMWLG